MTPICNENDPMSHLINSLEDIKDIYENYPNESKQLFYFMKNDIHEIFYDNDYVFHFESNDLQRVLPENSEKIKISELFYLSLLLSDQPEIINYSINIDYILKINNKLFNTPIDNSLQNIIISKIIIYLINYCLEQNEEDSENIQKLESMKQEHIDLIQTIMEKNTIFRRLNYTIDDVLNKNIDNIYLDIIILLIKTNKFSDFDYVCEIIENLDLKSIALTRVLYEGISQALNENNDYLKDYEIKNIKDLVEDKINFYYTLIKFIFKNVAYIYNIPFLKKNFMNIISFRDFFILNPDYDIYSKMQYLFELHSGYNINTQPNDNFIKITRYSNLQNAFIKDDNSSNECSSSNISDIYNEKNNKTNCIDNIFLNSAEQILNKVTITLMHDKNDKEGISYKIKQIKVNNNNLHIRFFTHLINNLNPGKNIIYKNYERLINLIDEIKEYISQNELNYTPDIKLEFKRDLEMEVEYYLNEPKNQKDKDIFYLTCTSSFVVNEKEGTRVEYKFNDYNVLVNGLDEEPNGFLYLINELNNEDYQFYKED
jgi:hypothetical protein